MGTGLSTQVGFAEESAWGTRVVPTRFLEPRSESMAMADPRIESESLRAGRHLTQWWVPNRKGAAGQIPFEVMTAGFGLIFKHCLGAIATTTPGTAVTAKDHTATLGALAGKGLTCQIGRPTVAGAILPFDYIGSKVAEWTLTNDVDGLLLLQLSLDSLNEDTSQALATPVYPTTYSPFHYAQGLITIGGVQADVTNVSLTGNNGLKTDRYFIRRSTLKKEQILDTAPRQLTGSFTAELEALTLYNDFANGVEAALNLFWQGPIIDGTLKAEVEVNYPRVRFDGQTPNVGGPDIVSQPLQFKALDPLDGSSAVSIRYRTNDATP